MYVSYVCEYVFANFFGTVPVAKVTQINQQKFNFKNFVNKKNYTQTVNYTKSKLHKHKQ